MVGNFDFVEARSRDDDIALRVYTPRGKKLQGTFALGVAAEAVTFLASYFSCQFPLPKLDFMVISDFALSNTFIYAHTLLMRYTHINYLKFLTVEPVF